MSKDYNLSIQPKVTVPVEEKQQLPTLAVKGQSNETTDKVKNQEVLTKSTSSQMQGLGKSYPPSSQARLQSDAISRALIQMIKFLNRNKPLMQTTVATVMGAKTQKAGNHHITPIASKKLTSEMQIEQARNATGANVLNNTGHTIKGSLTLKKVFNSVISKQTGFISTNRELYKITVQTNTTRKQVNELTKELNALKSEKKEWEGSIRLMGEASPAHKKEIAALTGKIEGKQGELEKLTSDLNLNMLKLNALKDAGMIGRISVIDIMISVNGVLQRTNAAAAGIMKILTPTDKNQAFVTAISAKIDQAVSKNQKRIDAEQPILDRLKQNNKQIEVTDKNGNTSIRWEKNHQDISDSERTIAECTKNINKYKAIQKKVQESPSEVRKQLSSLSDTMHELKPILDFKTAAGSTKKVTDALQNLANQIHGPKEAKEKFSQELDSISKEILPIIDSAEKTFNEELENPGITVLFNMYTMEGENLTFDKPDVAKLMRPFLGDITGFTALKLPDACEAFEKTFIRGQLLKGIYGAEGGLPPYPMGGGTFKAEDQNKIQEYFNTRTTNPELAKNLTKAYMELCENYVTRGGSQTKYLQAAENFVKLFNSIPKQVQESGI